VKVIVLPALALSKLYHVEVARSDLHLLRARARVCVCVCVCASSFLNIFCKNMIAYFIRTCCICILRKIDGRTPRLLSAIICNHVLLKDIQKQHTYKRGVNSTVQSSRDASWVKAMAHKKT